MAETSETSWVGRPMRRREDGELVRGRGTYADDLSFANAAHLAFVRSPIAHARLRAVDGAAAAALPGVLAVVTAQDLAGVVGPLPVGTIPLPEGMESAVVPQPILAAEIVRFSGEPVAAVLAETRAIAEDAAELVEVDLDPLPTVGDLRRAMAGEVLLHEEAPGNVVFRWRLGEGDVESAFASAHRVVEARIVIPRLAAAPIEPRGCVAAHDEEGDLLTLWCSSQDPHRPRLQIARVFGRPPERVRVVVPEVGGAFGSKGGLAAEHAVACHLAMRAGRSVKWIETRSENFLAAYQGRGAEVDASLAVGGDGRFLALRVRLLADAGAYLLGHTSAAPVNAAILLSGAYDIPAAEVEVIGVATNRVPTGPCRGAGRPEATLVIERLADLAAVELGMDPVEIRRRNLIRRFPHRTPLGSSYDSGDYERAMDRVLELADYPGWRERQASARAEGRLVGVGVAVFVESSGNGAWETAAATLAPDGHVILRTGSTAHGQGHQTTFAQIAADAFGLDPDVIEVRQGDSAEVPLGVGTFASRSTAIGGSATASAVTELRRRAGLMASHLLEVPEQDLSWDAGRFVVAGSPDRSVSLRDIALAAADGRMAPGVEDLEPQARFVLPDLVYGSGAYVAVVEVDEATGDLRILRLAGVDDAGTIVNPLLAEGQVIGSAVQGLAAALFEEIAYDEDGQLVTGSFLAYGTPSAADVHVEIESELQETPSPRNPLGAKGIGESGTIAVPAALANAVADALSPLGVRHVDLPLVPERIWRLAGGNEA